METSEEKIEMITNNIIEIFSKNKEIITKNKCKEILNIIFESLFDKKLNKKNFEEIYKSLNKKNEKFLTKDELEPIIKSFIVSFDVNFVSNSKNFKIQDDIVCIKMKNSLPFNYYLKKNETI